MSAAFVHKNDDDSAYVCTLPNKFLKIAEKDLRETESRRRQSLIQMREWIEKHPNIQNSRRGEYS